MPRYRQQKPGQQVVKQPSGFPLFAERRCPTVVTGDPWSYLRHLAVKRLPKAEEAKAVAYLYQGQDFFEAARSPSAGSKPLLYYYAFLNLVKAGLLVSGIPLPAKATHGIADPRVNERARLKLPGQSVQWSARAGDHSAIFPELLTLLGHSGQQGRMSLKALLRQLPAVHRTLSTVTSEDELFLVTEKWTVKHASGSVWATVSIRRSEAEKADLLKRVSGRKWFYDTLTRVEADDAESYCFETAQFPGNKRGVDNGIRQLTHSLRALGLAAILTQNGYRIYFGDFAAASRIPQLAAAYAVMFYLGSVTRYKPYDFEKIMAGGYSWVVNEFLATQATQFVYCFASTLSGAAVVRPYAVR